MAQDFTTIANQTPLEYTPPRSGSLEQNGARELCIDRNFQMKAVRHNPVTVGVRYYARTLQGLHPMTDNPYAAPKAQSTAVGVLSGSREDLRGVAKFQKGILICILIYFGAVIGQFMLPPNLRPFLGIGMLAVGVVSAVFIFRLAMKVYGTGVGVVLGILAVVPLIGLIILLIVNGKATGILKQNGIKVGLLGADTSAI